MFHEMTIIYYYRALDFLNFWLRLAFLLKIVTNCFVIEKSEKSKELGVETV